MITCATTEAVQNYNHRRISFVRPLRGVHMITKQRDNICKAAARLTVGAPRGRLANAEVFGGVGGGCRELYYVFRVFCVVGVSMGCVAIEGLHVQGRCGRAPGELYGMFIVRMGRLGYEFDAPTLRNHAYRSYIDNVYSKARTHTD